MKNIILICALIAVSIMCVGLFLYDYVPSGLLVAKANTYETSGETTKILDDALDAQEMLTSQSQGSSSTSDSTESVKTNIILKEYNISKTDLAMYKQSGDLQQGRDNPFAEIPAEEEVGTGDNNSSSGGTTSSPTNSGSTASSQNVVSDVTFYNSSKVK